MDIDAIIWLENLLKAFEGSLVVITHDRRFLDNIATRIVELDRGILRSYPARSPNTARKKRKSWRLKRTQPPLRQIPRAGRGVDTQRHRSAPYPQRRRVRRLEELRRQRAERRNVQGQVNFKLDSGKKSGKIIAELEHASFAYDDKVIMDKFPPSCSAATKSA
ncbi:hypothetical protein ACFFKZ_12330 [Neisseria gonorrhoeae]